MCRVVSSVLGRGCLLWPVCSLDKSLVTSAHFILYSKAKLACYSRYLLTSYFCIPIPCDEKCMVWGMLVLEGLVGLHRTSQLQLHQHQWLEHRLGLLWRWMVCLGNEPRSFCHFGDSSKDCILDSCWLCERDSISSNGLLSISSVHFSCSVMCNSLWPHGLQHIRLPCPSQLPEFTQTHVHWVSDAIQPSHLLSSPSPPAFNLS